MPRRSEIHALLHNFLDTFVSRYSRFQRYWLFGFLVPRSERLEFDLLEPVPSPCELSRERVAQLIAFDRFHGLASRTGLLRYVSAASLTIEQLPGTFPVQVNGINMPACRLSLIARAVTDLGREYKTNREVDVAVHSDIEQPSV